MHGAPAVELLHASFRWPSTNPPPLKQNKRAAGNSSKSREASVHAGNSQRAGNSLRAANSHAENAVSARGNGESVHSGEIHSQGADAGAMHASKATLSDISFRIGRGQVHM